MDFFLIFSPKLSLLIFEQIAYHDIKFRMKSIQDFASSWIHITFLAVFFFLGYMFDLFKNAFLF